MEIVQKDSGDVSPATLLRTGKSWSRLYTDSIANKNPDLFPGIYCLFSALEMYLKAYIVLKDSDFRDSAKIKSLEHNFSKIYEKISTLSAPKLTNEVKKSFNHYKLWGIKISDIKYPQDGLWLVRRDLLSGNHTLQKIFEIIDEEVSSGQKNWLERTYPRKSKIVGVLSVSRKNNDVSQKQMDEWLDICPKCRPKGVMIYLSWNYPWSKEKSPIRFCKKCGLPYYPEDISSETFSDSVS